MIYTNGFHQVNAQVLDTIATPVVEDVRSIWKPVKHSEVAAATEQAIDGAGLSFADPNYHVSPDGLTYIAEYVVDAPTEVLPKMDSVQHTVAVMHSNDKRIALKVVAGANVQVCTNGMVIGERVVSKKHTTGLDLFASFRIALDHYVKQAQTLPFAIESFKQTDVSRNMADHLLVEAGRLNLLPWSGIGKVVKEMKSPTFEAFSDSSAWSLYNAFTHVIKGAREDKQVVSNREFFKLVRDNAVNASL